MNGTARPPGYWAAVVLAVGLVLAVNAITFAAVWVAVFNRSNVEGGLSQNATELLSVTFGGIIGILGSYMGVRAAQGTATPPAGDRDAYPPVPTYVTVTKPPGETPESDPLED